MIEINWIKSVRSRNYLLAYLARGSRVLDSVKRRSCTFPQSRTTRSATNRVLMISRHHQRAFREHLRDTIDFVHETRLFRISTIRLSVRAVPRSVWRPSCAGAIARSRGAGPLACAWSIDRDDRRKPPPRVSPSLFTSNKKYSQTFSLFRPQTKNYIIMFNTVCIMYNYNVWYSVQLQCITIILNVFINMRLIIYGILPKRLFRIYRPTAKRLNKFIVNAPWT